MIPYVVDVKPHPGRAINQGLRHGEKMSDIRLNGFLTS
jgi:hypothetical protein